MMTAGVGQFPFESICPTLARGWCRWCCSRMVWAVPQATGWSLKVDAARIMAAGHSYGANTALLVAGAQVERENRLVELRDRRFKAAVLLSAPPFHGE